MLSDFKDLCCQKKKKKGGGGGGVRNWIFLNIATDLPLSGSYHKYCTEHFKTLSVVF